MIKPLQKLCNKCADKLGKTYSVELRQPMKCGKTAPCDECAKLRYLMEYVVRRKEAAK